MVDTYKIPPLTVSIFSTSIGLRRERYGGDIIHSLSPGFRVTQSLDVFFRNTKLHRYFDTLRLHLRLVRAFAESRCISLLFYPQQLAILFRLAVPHFSTGAYTLTLRCCSGRNWSQVWHTHNETKGTPQLDVCTSLPDTGTAPHKQTQPAKLRTAPYGVREGVGCARQQP